MNDWQPIETAPRDGTRVLAYGLAYPELVKGNGRWFTSEIGQKLEPFVMPIQWVEHWYDQEVDNGDGTYRKQRVAGIQHWGPEPRAFTPTHWMPLPPPPT